MKIVIFGAAGATGRILVEQALAQGHEVTAFDRQTAALSIQHPKLTLIQGDIFNPAQVEEAMFADKVLQEQEIRQSELDWIIVRPARLTDGPRTGDYKVGAPLLMGPRAKISRADVADFLLKQVSAETYVHQVPRLRY